MSKLDDLLAQKTPPAPDDLDFTREEIIKLFWKCKGLIKHRDRDKAFWEATNENLTEAYEKLDKQDKELAAMYGIIKNDLDLASSIQSNMFPRELPDIEGYSIGAVCKMARESGGDFYDVIPMGRGRYFLIIGDVCGKGLPASLYMSSCINIIRALVEERELSVLHQDFLKSVAVKVNKLLMNIMNGDSFITLYLAILDSFSHTLTYLSAGHLPCIVYHPGQKTQAALNTPGLACGIIEPELFDNDIAEYSTSIQEGAYHILYTDGVTEAKDSAGTQYEERFFRAIQNISGVEPADRVIETLLEDLFLFTGESAQFDDITVVCFKRNQQNG